ncbi:MAG: DNA polymerase, partial [Paraclostridium sp.]
MIDKLIKTICPNMPSDRRIEETKDIIKFYKVQYSNKTLFVPNTNILKFNMLQLSNFIESLQAFEKMDFNSPEYKWDNLNLYSYEGEECETGFEFVRLLSQNRKIGIDIETKGIMWENNKLLSIGFATDVNTCYAFYNIPKKAYKALQELLNDGRISFVWHNGKFDCGRLKYTCDLNARIDEDTMLQHFARINEKQGTHKLKDLGPLYLQAPQWDDELESFKKDFCKKNRILLNNFTYDLIPIEILIPYMQRDCISTLRLFYKFQELSKPSTEFIYYKLIEASNVLCKVELNGIQIDNNYLVNLERILKDKIKEAKQQLEIVVNEVWNSSTYKKDTRTKIKLGENFNPKSPKQLKWIITKLIGYEPPSTNVKTLDDILNKCNSGLIANNKAKDFLEAIKILRTYTKQLDTYVQGTKNNLCRDYRIRGTYNLHGTETGRLSSSEPNMQNIPRDKTIKNLYIAKPGYTLVQFDYSQAELRVM